jgi:hypothetical protein
MMTGETMTHEPAEPPEDDYFRPHYLHSAAEFYEMPGNLDGFHGGTGPEMEYEYGKYFDPFGE